MTLIAYMHRHACICSVADSSTLLRDGDSSVMITAPPGLANKYLMQFVAEGKLLHAGYHVSIQE